MSDASSPSRLVNLLRDLLHQPNRLGLVLNLVLLVAWYLATYSPLHRAIAQDDHRLNIGRQRLALAHEVEHLRQQAEAFSALLPESDEGDIWVPFIMSGVRQFPEIKLVSLEPRPSMKVGPYSASAHRIVLEGNFPVLEQFVRWLEASPRLIRIDSIQVSRKTGSSASQGGGLNEMQLLLIGVEG
ncbi:hypothetical protein [Tautonia marina]|uniref:hypothetical protein n=1 Tax=Tautonia marina TaxID=2653855 RepID=UPI00126067D2|nr:hypothetical protein [Tautonia marina]